MLLKMFLVICLFLNYDVKSQICTKQQVLTRWVQEKYQYTYRVTYMDKCFFGRQCKKTRIEYTDNMRSVPKRVVESTQVCCSGYRSLDIYTSSGDISCSPICSPACKYGYCSSPGVCQCNLGFVTDPASPHSCLPTCGDCGYGKCVAPNVCECNFGYSLQNDTCLAICTESCHYGTCVAPDTCECLPGYRKSVSNICTPYCTQGCWHGTCIAPETCVCDKGWHKAPTNECVPLCETECGNGTCTAPNVCECEAGYRIDETKAPKCVPRCNAECGNGTCVAPNVCECAAGYLSNTNKEPMCEPVCENECGHGTCNAPNTCECSAGYRADETKVPICRPDCALCEGTCIAPGKCECEEPFKANLVTADGQKCDDTTHKCERTVCTIEATGRSTEENISYGYDDFLINDTIKVNVTKNESEDDPNSLKYNDYDSEQMYNITSNGTIDIDVITGTKLWTQSKWAYAAMSVAGIFVVIIFALVAIYWKTLLRCCRGGSYTIDDKAKGGPNQEHNSTMKLSSLLKRKEDTH